MLFEISESTYELPLLIDEHVIYTVFKLNEKMHPEPPLTKKLIPEQRK
jgi:hypothetical protein